MEKEKIWKEYHNTLRSFVYSKVKGYDICNDLMQETYIRMHQHIEELKDASRIRPWLFSIAGNVVMDHFRERKNKVSNQLKEVAEEETKQTNSFEKCLVPHINKLPLKYRQAFTKVELENYSQLDLADELRISYSGAKSRVQRAKQLLKKYFKECCNITTDKYGNIISSSDHTCSTC